MAISKTMDDEIVLAEIDLDDVKLGKKTTFDFGRHRRLESYEVKCVAPRALDGGADTRRRSSRRKLVSSSLHDCRELTLDHPTACPMRVDLQSFQRNLVNHGL